MRKKLNDAFKPVLTEIENKIKYNKINNKRDYMFEVLRRTELLNTLIICK